MKPHDFLPPLPPCPLDAVRRAVQTSLCQQKNLVLSAPPGAGKSSRLPLWLLAAPWRRQRKILLLEPRRVVARALARHMAALLGEQAGETVGFRTRDESRVSRQTCVEVVTEGVLTQMLQENPELPHTACVLFDEFHERSLAADMGLALCLESQDVLRPDLRLVVMSATLDMGNVSSLLGGCPVLEASGKSFPVELRYRPLSPTKNIVPGHGANPDLWRHMADVIAELVRTEGGNLLAFCPGVSEIRQTETLLRPRLPDNVTLHSLHGGLPAADQDAAIAPAPTGLRKIVLATSIAETSLTIEGIRLVVDCGLARLPRFDPDSGQTRLTTQRVSLAGATQRSGRAGRTMPGLCCRLWAQEEESSMPPHIRPEILDADLTDLVLQLAAWGAAPENLAWADPPAAARLSAARRTLQMLGALDGQSRLTTAGREMAALPMNARTARLVLQARKNGHAALGCCLAALLEDRDPFAGSDSNSPEGCFPPDCDMRLRTDWLCREPEQPENLHPALRQRLRRQAARLARRMEIQGDIFRAAAQSTAHTGSLLALAWPEHVAVRQNTAGTHAHFLLRSGRAAFLPVSDSLAREKFLAVALPDGAGARSRIRLAAALDAECLEDIFAHDVQILDTLETTDTGRITARRTRRLGALLLEDSPLPAPAPEQCAAVLCAHVRTHGLGCLPWNDACIQWRARALLLHQMDPGIWPDISDAALLESLEDWLGPELHGCLRLDEITPERLLACMQTRLPHPLRLRLEEQAPSHWRVPSGSMRPIVYGEDGGPWLAVKLQEMFGCRETPRIANGRVALAVRLLSPAGRPLQITRDLAHFWRVGYPAVRAEMRGRYPKHPWPEDPLSALPTGLTQKKLAAHSPAQAQSCRIGHSQAGRKGKN